MVIKVYKDDLGDFLPSRRTPDLWVRKVDQQGYIECHYMNSYCYDSLQNGEFEFIGYDDISEDSEFWISEYNGKEWLHIDLGSIVQESLGHINQQISEIKKLLTGAKPLNLDNELLEGLQKEILELENSKPDGDLELTQ